MSDIKYVYWKTKADADPAQQRGISGFCRSEDVPAYGETGACPLPREITVTTDTDGTITAVSPPVIGGRFAYRYQLRLTKSARESVPLQRDVALETMLIVMHADAPVAGAQRENWWWYAKDRFHTLGYRKSTPVSLMKKWKRAMLEILLETHPDKEEKIAAWETRVAAHKAHVADRSASRTRAHRKAHGDLVVLPHSITFNSGRVKQIFRYNIEKPSLGNRAKHSLKIGSTRYRVAHSSAMAFRSGTAPSDEISLPVRLAMCLLAWSEAPHDSAHAVLAATGRFQKMANDLTSELESAIRDYPEQRGRSWSDDIAAAISALCDFHPVAPHQDAAPVTVRGHRHISDEIDQALALLRLGEQATHSQAA